MMELLLRVFEKKNNQFLWENKMHKNLKPLEEFICDVCGEIINSPKEGYVIWRSDRDHDRLQYDFKIIHQMICDDRSCGNSMPLKKFLGVDGLSYLLAFYSLGPLKTFPLPDRKSVV